MEKLNKSKIISKYMQPWTKIYQPKKISELQGQNTAITQLKLFIDNFKKGKRSALIHGPTGSGKTAAIYALANDLNYEVIEINASDQRKKDDIEQLVGSASKQMSLFNKGKLILIDEIDGISGTKDRGGIPAILKIIEKTAFPIIFTANDPWDSKFSTLRKKSELIAFHTLNYLSVHKVLENICKNEKISFNESALKSLARSAGGDLRSVINDLQLISQGTKKLNKNDVEELSQRNKKKTMINALMIIFKTLDPKIAISAFDEVKEDINKRFLWIDENLPKEYTKPKDIDKAYNQLSRADIFQGRIRRWQHWRFLSYINILLSAGIALSKDEKYEGFNKYSPTKRILKMWQANITNQKRKAIAEKIAEKTHISIKRSFQQIPYIKAIARNKDIVNSLKEEFNLEKEEISWLKA
jgi:replication factor C large subunit